MIRLILAFCLMGFSLTSVMFGVHPIYSVITGIVGLVFLGWYFISKFEDNPPYIRY